MHFLREFIPLFGVPSCLRSDQGSAFTSHDVAQLCKVGFTQVFSPVADHRITGTVERLIRNLRERSSACHLSRGPSFVFSPTLLSMLQDLRASWHRITGRTSHSSFFGSSPDTRLSNSVRSCVSDNHRILKKGTAHSFDVPELSCLHDGSSVSDSEPPTSAPPPASARRSRVKTKRQPAVRQRVASPSPPATA